MVRITKMHVTLAVVTMVMVNVGRETYITDFDAWM